MNRSTFSKALQQPVSKASSANTSAGLRNLHQLIQLRWIAVVGQLLTIQATHYSLGLPLPLQAMLSIVAGMVVFNIASLLRWRTRRGVHDVELFIGLLIDVAALTAQLYLSGGIGNPFVFLYLLQIAVGAMLLRGGYIWSIVVVASACVVLLAQHSQPRPWPPMCATAGPAPMCWACWCASCSTPFWWWCSSPASATTCAGAMRAWPPCASGRQKKNTSCAWGCWHRALRMNWHAAGHPGRDPGDWKRIPALTQDPVLQEEIAEMEAQVKRCKTIVSGILLSAGEARGESSSQTTVRQFLDTLVQNWRATRSVDTFVYDNLLEGRQPHGGRCHPGANGFNVLDNARDASPHWVRLQAQCDADALRIVVTDRGPGFSAAVLRHIGTPYQSTKRAAGGGLGLFLSMNVARTLGGSVVARNRPEGGAEVTITLSLAAITLQDTDSEDHGH